MDEFDNGDTREYYEDWLKRDLAIKIDSYLCELIKEKIRRDPIYFIENWVWTYDPRRPGSKNVPFKLYDFQKRFILKLNENYLARKPILVEKSRDMGFSWCVLAFITWKAITEKNFSAGIGSRKAQLVDELGNMKSLMERIRFILRRLPAKLRAGWGPKHSKNFLINIPGTQATISGEAGDEIGRGDRTSLYLLDEFAFIPRSSTVQAAVSQTSDFLIYGSTPNGKGNEFARLRWKTDIDHFIMDWKDHPRKNQEWYEKQKQLMDEVTIAQEIDRSYSKSKAGRVHQWFDVEKHGSKLINYDSNHPGIITFDWGIGDPTAALFIQYIAGYVRIFDCYERKDTEISKIFVDIHEKCLDNGFTFHEVCGWYGDPDGRNRNLVTGESIAQFIKSRYKINLRYKLPNVIRNRIMSVRMLGEHGRILVSSKCAHVIECFENYRFPDKESGDNEKPVHDWTSHTMSALEYYCVYEHGMDQLENQNREITATRIR